MKRSRNNMGGVSFTKTNYRGGGGGGLRTGGFLGAEVKYLDLVRTPAQVPITWTGSQINPNRDPVLAASISPGCLVPIPQGSGARARIGRACTLRRITIRGSVGPGTATLATGSSNFSSSWHIRILLVKDTQTNNALLNTNAETAGIIQPGFLQVASYAPQNLEHQRRFKILCDKNIVINPSTSVVQESGAKLQTDQQRAFVIDKAVNMPVTYTGADTLLANMSNVDIVDNSLHIYCMAHRGDVNEGSHDGSNLCFIRYAVRLRFEG